MKFGMDTTANSQFLISCNQYLNLWNESMILCYNVISHDLQ
jgi:hypothetical protein